MPDPGQRLIERATEPLRARMITLQQMESHALRRFHADARQALQRIDQTFERRFAHLPATLH